MIVGIYEQPIIIALQRYFSSKGLTVYPHAHLNIAWANVVSDVDLLLLSKKEAIAIEVKSKKDVFKRAFLQLNRIEAFVDRTFIATDNEAMADKFKATQSETGILYVNLNHNKIIMKKAAVKHTIRPPLAALYCLRKCCLQELAREFKVAHSQSKQYIALDIHHAAKAPVLRSRLKDIVSYRKHLHMHD